MKIRRAIGDDGEQIAAVHVSAFPEGESAEVSKLARELLAERTTPETFSLVAEDDGLIVGHIAFSPVTAGGNDGFKGFILSPLGVKTEFQKNGIGGKLIEHGVRHLSDMGVNVLFVYGDPGYYGRFGFSNDAGRGYTAPYELRYPSGWQAIALNKLELKKLPVTLTCVAALANPLLW